MKTKSNVFASHSIPNLISSYKVNRTDSMAQGYSQPHFAYH